MNYLVVGSTILGPVITDYLSANDDEVWNFGEDFDFKVKEVQIKGSIGRVGDIIAAVGDFRENDVIFDGVIFTDFFKRAQTLNLSIIDPVLLQSHMMANVTGPMYLMDSLMGFGCLEKNSKGLFVYNMENREEGKEFIPYSYSVKALCEAVPLFNQYRPNYQLEIVHRLTDDDPALCNRIVVLLQ